MLIEFETGYDIVFTTLLPDEIPLLAAFKKTHCAVQTNLEQAGSRPRCTRLQSRGNKEPPRNQA
jgi:hypothetical protein